MKHIPKVLTAFASRKNGGIVISVMTLAELEHGLYKSLHTEKNAKNLNNFLSTVQILPFEAEAAIQYGRICTDLERKGTTISTMDMLIAAHAKAAGLVVVTNNTKEFERVEGLEIENWA